MARKYDCKECQKPTEVVYDNTTGDSICTECGLVLEARCIDETSEWRTFADDTQNHDPNRVGAPINPVDGDPVLSTYTVCSGNGDIRWIKNRRADPDHDRSKSIANEFDTVANICDRLSLPTLMKDLAKEFYKMLKDQKCNRGRTVEILAAACIYHACRREGKPRTPKEICSVVDGSLKDIRRAIKFVEKQLERVIGHPVEVGSIQAEDCSRRFCSKLDMSHIEMKAVQEALRKSGDLDIRRNPTSIVAALIVMITRLSNTKRSLKDISDSTKVAEATIRIAYKDLCPRALKLIPDWFAKDKDLNKLYR